ncbi:MAG: zinc-dependent metalloprotease [Gemmatimonadaceae bacterium]
MTVASRALAAVLLLLAVQGCTRLHAASAPAPQQAKAPEKKGPFASWDSTLKDSRRIDGYFITHLKRDNTLYIELRPEQFNREFGLGMHLSHGIGDYDLHQGLPLTDLQLVHFARAGDQVRLVRRNPRFTSDSASPMRTSQEGNVGNSTVAVFKIESENDTTKAVLINATPFIASDYADISTALKFEWDKKPGTFDKDRSYVGHVMGFPRNVEIDGELTFDAAEPPPRGSDALSDYRWLPVGVRYSLIALPENPMRPRIADDRVGQFLEAVEDFSRDRQPDPYLRYVDRWRLEKKDHSKAVSDPVQPIVYYIDRSVPMQYRQYVREGILGWNRAFEAAGISNAIVVKDAPDDTTWSAEDMRYSTVRWTAAHRMGYAIGPSTTDPRTGEILNADILISWEFVRAWQNEYDRLSGPQAWKAEIFPALNSRSRLPAALAARECVAEASMGHQLAVQYAFLTGLGTLAPGEPMPEKYIGDALRWVVMHEVGHTLGLRHNFKSSTGTPYDRLNDTTFTHRNGLTLSVMDYPPVNVAIDPKRQGDYFGKVVGSYDLWAIRYAYAPVYQQASPPTSGDGVLPTSGMPVSRTEDEAIALRHIAAEAAEPLHTYGTDEDNWLGPFAVDPLSNAGDLGSEPVAYARDRIALIQYVQPRLQTRLIADGEGYQRLRNATTSLLFERLNALLPVTKTVGGLYTARDHNGDPNGRAPFVPVPAAKQREAVKLIVDGAFAAGAMKLDPDRLNHLAPNRWAHFDLGDSFNGPVDYPVHDIVAGLQGALLDELLAPPRLRRIVDNTARMPNGEPAYTVGELFETLTSAIWSELGTGGQRLRNVDSFRRNLQRTYIGRFTQMLMPSHDSATAGGAAPLSDAPEDARALARYELTRLSRRLAAAQSSPALDLETRAHFAESKVRIDRALTAISLAQ